MADSLKETIADICCRKRKDGKLYRGLNPWDSEDFRSIEFLCRGEIQLNGFRNHNLRSYLYPESEDPNERKRASSKISRRLRLLRTHGLIRKLPRTHRYVLTLKGRRIANAVMAASSANTDQLIEMAA